ncbi:MAG: hypothetical protein ABSE82_09830 [Nitrososphaerales archaeon]|jgi:hypothetical protein
MAGETGRIDIRIHHVDVWEATWIVNKALNVSEKYHSEVEFKSKPTGSYEIAAAILVPITIYSGKKTIDLVFDEIKTYLERRRLRQLERENESFDYEITPYQ